MTKSELEAALDHLPHGPAFRFVDRLLELDPGKSGRGEYRVKGDEPFLAGHFPGEPLFPGVLLVEAAAQLAGVVAQSDPEIPPLRGLKLTGLGRTKIMGTARPGECFQIHARITGRMGGLAQAEGVISMGDMAILKTQLTLSGEESRGAH